MRGAILLSLHQSSCCCASFSTRFDSWQVQMMFLSSTASGPAVRPIQPSVRRVPKFFRKGVKRLGLKVTTHFHLMSEAIPPLFVAWCVIKSVLPLPLLSRIHDHFVPHSTKAIRYGTAHMAQAKGQGSSLLRETELDASFRHVLHAMHMRNDCKYSNHTCPCA